MGKALGDEEYIFQSTLPLRGATAKMHKFGGASLAKFSGFCDFLQIGENSHSRKQSEVVVFLGGNGVRTSPGFLLA